MFTVDGTFGVSDILGQRVGNDYASGQKGLDEMQARSKGNKVFYT